MARSCFFLFSLLFLSVSSRNYHHYSSNYIDNHLRSSHIVLSELILQSHETLQAREVLRALEGPERENPQQQQQQHEPDHDCHDHCSPPTPHPSPLEAHPKFRKPTPRPTYSPDPNQLYEEEDKDRLFASQNFVI